MNTTINLGEFETFAHMKPDKAQALKPLEEAAEVFGAYQNMMTCAETYAAVVDDVDGRAREIAEGAFMGYRESMVDECADVCQAVANLLAALGVDGDEWAAAVGRCEKRNRERGRY